MGGTSTDVSRYAGKYEHTFETITAGYSLQIPQLDINTIAAGGGSMLFFQAGMFVVGPESAGSEPGLTLKLILNSKLRWLILKNIL